MIRTNQNSHPKADDGFGRSFYKGRQFFCPFFLLRQNSHMVVFRAAGFSK